MTAHLGPFLVGLVLMLQSLSGLPISQAAPPSQSAYPAISALADEPVPQIEEPGVFVQADGTSVKQGADSPPAESSFVPDACALPAPNLISPVGGAQVDTLIPYFQWSRTGDRYRFQVSTRTDFSVLLDNSHWIIGGTSDPRIDNAYNLTSNTTYYWRVASACQDWSDGAFSATASFRTGNVTGPFPDPPSMIAPADGALLSSVEVTFSWGNVPGATARQLRYYNSLAEAQSDDQWHEIPWGGAWSRHWSNSTKSTFSSGGTYYWRVGAGTDLGWGSLSPIRSFTVASGTYDISGRVADPEGNGISGITISDGAGHTATTDSSGNYTLASLSAGSYVIHPSGGSYVFCPAQRSVNLSANVSGLDFTAFAATVTLGFCPDPHGYRFSNSDGGWGSFPATAYDYGYAELARMFGQDQVCWMVGASCLVKPQADFWHWQANLSINGGHCDGMAATSLRFFKGIDQPSAFHPGAAAAHDLQLGEARRNIAYYSVEQFADPVGAYKEQIRQSTPSAILNQLRSAMQGGAPDPVTLFIRQSGEGGHAITPFAIEDRGANVSWVRVYDNNHPDDVSRYVIIDAANQTWSYNLGWTTWTGNASTKSLGIVPISKYAEQPVCPWCDNSLQMGAPDAPSMQEVWLHGAGHLLIRDALNRRLGYSGAQFVSEIPQAYGRFFDAGLGVEEDPIYELPVSSGYTILLHGQTMPEPEDVTVSQFGPGYAARISNIRLQSSDEDAITIPEDGSEIAYQPGVSRNVSLSLARDDADASYELEITGAELHAGQRVTLAQDDTTGRLVYSNAQAGGGVYGLRIRRVSPVGREWFAHHDLSIAAGDTHYADYRSWDGQGAMTLEIDHGSDGTIDETVPLENQSPKVYLPIITR